MPPAPRRVRLPLTAWCVALGVAVPAPGGEGALAEWLRSAVIPVPPKSLNFSALGSLVEVDGGNCTDLEVEKLQAVDLGSEGSPEVGYQLSGVSLRCTVDLQGVGRAVTARLRLGSSAVRLQLQAERQGAGLPFRRVLVTDCSFDAQISDLDFTGPSVLATLLHGASGVIHSFFEHSSTVMCSILSTFIEERSEAALGEAYGALRGELAEAADADARAAAALQSRRPSAATPLLDWRTYPPIVVIQALLSERSDIVAKLVRDASPLELPLGALLAGGGGPGVDAALVGRSIFVDGLDTLLEGDSPRFGGQGSALSASVAFRRLSATLALEAQVNVTSGKAQGGLQDTSSSLQDGLNVTVEAQDGSAALTALAMVSRPALWGLGVDQLQDPRCLGGSAAAATELSTSPVWLQTLTGNAKMGLKFEAQGRLERDAAAALEATAGALARGGGSEALAALALDGLGVARARGNKAIAEFSMAPGTCPDSNVYQGLPSATGLAFACAAFGAAALGCNFALTMAAHRGPRNGEALHQQDLDEYFGAEAMPKYAGAAPELMYHPQVDASASERHLGASWVVPRAVTVLYPVVAVAGLTLYLYADLSLAIVVDFVFRAGADEFRVSPALAFSVVICAADAWGAGAYAIALCIVLLSILGPFVKIAFLMLAWLVPPPQLEPEVRGRVLGLLDEYGKYSLVDSWLGILSLASYRRLSWHSTTADASFVVDPVPMLPFFAFFAATVLSLGLGHVAYGYHRRLEEEQLELCGAPRRSRCARPRSLRAFSSALEACGLTAALLATAAAIVVGAAVDSFEMVSSGVLVHVLLDPPATVQVYSLLELGAGIPLGNEQDVGLRMVQAIFFLFALLVPLLETAALLVVWLLPMPSKAQKAAIGFCHGLGAWAALDVFVLAVVVSYFEFGLFSTFLVYEGSIAKTCRAGRDVFSMDCFHMECALASGFPALLAAGCASFATPKAALAMCARALERRLREEEDEESPDEDTAVGVDPSDSDGLVSSDGSSAVSCWQLRTGGGYD